MIRAAIEVFTEAGYVGARMSDIADRAGVAVQTVYFTFHTKAELLQACFDFAVLGPERLPPMEQPFFADFLAARSGRAALAAFVHGNTAILRRSAAIKEVAESAPHEPDAAAVVDTQRASAPRRLGPDRRAGHRPVRTPGGTDRRRCHRPALDALLVRRPTSPCSATAGARRSTSSG